MFLIVPIQGEGLSTEVADVSLEVGILVGMKGRMPFQKGLLLECLVAKFTNELPGDRSWISTTLAYLGMSDHSSPTPKRSTAFIAAAPFYICMVVVHVMFRLSYI